MLGYPLCWYASCLKPVDTPNPMSPSPFVRAGPLPMVTRFERERRFEEIYLGYHIRERDGIFIAVPLEWAHGRGETIVSTDLGTLRDEIRRWWYQVGS